MMRWPWNSRWWGSQGGKNDLYNMLSLINPMHAYCIHLLLESTEWCFILVQIVLRDQWPNSEHYSSTHRMNALSSINSHLYLLVSSICGLLHPMTLMRSLSSYPCLLYNGVSLTTTVAWTENTVQTNIWSERKRFIVILSIEIWIEHLSSSFLLNLNIIGNTSPFAISHSSLVLVFFSIGN